MTLPLIRAGATTTSSAAGTAARAGARHAPARTLRKKYRQLPLAVLAAAGLACQRGICLLHGAQRIKLSATIFTYILINRHTHSPGTIFPTAEIVPHSGRRGSSAGLLPKLPFAREFLRTTVRPPTLLLGQRRSRGERPVATGALNGPGGRASWSVRWGGQSAFRLAI